MYLLLGRKEEVTNGRPRSAKPTLKQGQLSTVLGRLCVSDTGSDEKKVESDQKFL
jgi:hypothetical protein